MKAFGSKELQKCVINLGFVFDSISSNHHAKYNPQTNKTTVGEYPFFQFQLGRKTFDPNSANRFITQLKRFGFTKEEIEKHLR